MHSFYSSLVFFWWAIYFSGAIPCLARQMVDGKRIFVAICDSLMGAFFCESQWHIGRMQYLFTALHTLRCLASSFFCVCFFVGNNKTLIAMGWHRIRNFYAFISRLYYFLTALFTVDWLTLFVWWSKKKTRKKIRRKKCSMFYRSNTQRSNRLIYRFA